MIEFPQKPNGPEGCGKTMVLLLAIPLAAILIIRRKG